MSFLRVALFDAKHRTMDRSSMSSIPGSTTEPRNIWRSTAGTSGPPAFVGAKVGMFMKFCEVSKWGYSVDVKVG